MLLNTFFIFHDLSIYRDILSSQQISKDYKKDFLKFQYTYTYIHMIVLNRNNFLFLYFFFFLIILLCNKFNFFFFFWKISERICEHAYTCVNFIPFRVTTRAKKRCIVAILPRMPVLPRLQRITRISIIPPRKHGPT